MSAKEKTLISSIDKKMRISDSNNISSICHPSIVPSSLNSTYIRPLYTSDSSSPNTNTHQPLSPLYSNTNASNSPHTSNANSPRALYASPLSSARLIVPSRDWVFNI